MKLRDKAWIKRSFWIFAVVLVMFCAALIVLYPAGMRCRMYVPWLEGKTVEYRGETLPVMKGVAVNQYDTACFGQNEFCWRTYEKNGVSAKIGVDVSVYQGEIDWQQVAAAGVEFAMIRCGYRGYTQGAIQPDKYFEANMKGALEAGLEVGVYFFSQAIHPQEAQEEAEYVLNAIEGYKVTYPVVFDWEIITGSEDARTRGLGGQTLTDCATAFCDAIEQGGYDPVIYFNQDMGYLDFRLDQLKQYDFWLAEYNALPSFYYHFDLWQYTNRGAVPGIQGDVDLNLDFRPLYT